MSAYLPIGFVAENVAKIRAGAIAQVRRPGPLLAGVQPGMKLWLREPFHLDSKYDGFSPSTALHMGAVVTAWSADGKLPPDPNRGRKRFARELPRVAHRMHLVVAAVRREPLCAITDTDCLLEGARDRHDFATQWDRLQAGGRTISGDKSLWRDNPDVTVITFDAVPRPLR